MMRSPRFSKPPGWLVKTGKAGLSDLTSGIEGSSTSLSPSMFEDEEYVSYLVAIIRPWPAQLNASNQYPRNNSPTQKRGLFWIFKF
jgi:hypothetical protein